ncbi:MAG: PD-(D/E)XK nuclease family protein [Elusimicrobia bacterium]|nr:PD-(D/E)XK nuclease family protein [Elusimicrobiota bacterium]
MKNESTDDFLPGLLGPEPKKKIKVVNSFNSKIIKPLTFSYSKLSLYEECSLKYKFKYIDKLPEEPKFYFALGNSIHHAMEFMYAVKSPPFPEIKDVLKEFDREWKMKNWMQKGYNSLAHEEKDYKKAVEMLNAYYEKHHKTFIVPFLLEYRTTLEVDGLRVIIIVDKINYLGNGEIEIIDYKTGKNISRSTDQVHLYQKICELDPKLKEKIYQICGERVQSVKVRNMEYYYIPCLREIKFERGQDTDIQNLWDRALKAADGIRANEFEANPGELQCKFCDFKASCPIFTNNKGIITSENEPINYDKDEEYSKLASLVDEYGKISNRINTFNKELEELKSEISKAFKKKKIASYSGNNYSLHMKKTEKWSFNDREAVINILKTKGLYEKVLAPVLKNIVDLLSDETLTESVKKEIRSQGDKTDIFNFEVGNISK